MQTYLNLWQNCDKIMNISESDYLQIFLKKNWKKKVIKLLKWIYSLNKKAHQLIDEKFDELHHQEQMKWSTQSTLFNFSVFIIWKTVIQSDSTVKWKKHIVVNIWDLNWISQLNFYFLSLQTDIISVIQNCQYIFTVNCVFFFY